MEILFIPDKIHNSGNMLGIFVLRAVDGKIHQIQREVEPLTLRRCGFDRAENQMDRFLPELIQEAAAQRAVKAEHSAFVRLCDPGTGDDLHEQVLGHGEHGKTGQKKCLRPLLPCAVCVIGFAVCGVINFQERGSSVTVGSVLLSGRNSSSDRRRAFASTALSSSGERS